jgi:hypothetical protein
MSEELSIVGSFVIFLTLAVFFTWMITSICGDIGHSQLGAAGHTCFANHTCRENLVCHYGEGDKVGICLGKR